MTPKTIAVVYFDAAEAERLSVQACEVARGFDAHLVGIHPYAPLIFYGGFGGEPIVYTTIQDWQDSEAETIGAAFDDAVRKADLRGEFRSQDRHQGAEPFLLSSIRSADLVLLAGGDGHQRSPDDSRLAEQAIRQAGRPALVLPAAAGLAGPPARILIGWSDTREATRAAHDAIALAAPGAAIDLLSLHARAGEEPPGLDCREDFAAALDRLGFQANVLDRNAVPEDRGETLLTAARERDAELVVTGAFGHSSVYDFVIGAVTSHLLEKADRPVLLSK